MEHHFWMVVNLISTWVLTNNGATCQCLISMKDFPFLYHLENEKYKIVGYGLVRAQNAQVSEAILVKVDSILVLGFLQSVLEGSKSLEEYCGVTAYYKVFQHLVGLKKDCLFKKNDDFDI